MASKGKSGRWIVLGLVALGVAVAATWPRSSSDQAREAEPEPPEAKETSAARNRGPAPELDGGMASRRVTEGCDPVEESLKYEELVGQRALAILSWNGMSERAANLKVPIKVVGIEDGAVGVRFMDFPMRAQYIGIWLGSEHIRAGEKDVFLLDPCSATIIEWTAMERAGTTDDEDLDEDALLDDELLEGE